MTAAWSSSFSTSIPSLQVFIKTLGVVLVLCTREVIAAPLMPGGVLYPPPVIPGVGGDPQVGHSSAFHSSTFHGFLSATAYKNEPSNPFGLDKLTFTYVLRNFDDDGAPSGLNRLTIINFAGYLVDAGYAAGTGLAPTLIDRGLPPGGEEIGFSFYEVLGPGSLPPGQSSALLVVHTNATDWITSEASVINGGSATVRTPAPIPIPEPNLAVVALAGTLALAIRSRSGSGLAVSSPASAQS